MSIKAKLFLANILMFLAALIPGSVLLRSYLEVPQSLKVTRNIYSLVHELTLLNNAMVDIRVRDIHRAKSQWISISNQIEEYIDELSHTGVDARFYNTLDETNKLIRRLFLGIDTADVTTLTEEQRKFLIGQVNLKTHDMIMVGHILLSVMQEDLQVFNSRALQYVLAFFFLVLVIMILEYFFLTKYFVEPIIELEKCVTDIGKGDFDRKVPLSEKDELGSLSQAINKMRKDLKLLTRSKEEFLSTAAHELKTPITVLKTTTQLMEGMDKSEVTKFLPYALKTINRQCNLLNKLVVDVLEVSRLELEQTELRKSCFSMATLVDEVVHNMSKISDKHSLIIQENTSANIVADRTRIEEVLVNILDNSIKYTPGGGDVLINSKVENNQLQVSVSDHGIGIPKERQAKVFQRFYRAHSGTSYEQVTSMGVGLFLSKQFINKHGGEIGFNSIEGEGTTFFFTVPLGNQDEL